MNFCLYQCDQEGGEEGGFGVYDVPNYGRLNYCGLAGLVPVLNRMRHPLTGLGGRAVGASVEAAPDGDPADVAAGTRAPDERHV